MSEVTSVAQVLGFDEALHVVLRHAANVRHPEIEQLPLLASAGRVLAEQVRADRDQPPFDRATRDGFAVRAVEWSSGGPFRVVGRVRAGSVWTGATPPPQSAVEIMTGAPVPAWADAVAMIEHAELAREEVSAQKGRQLRVGDNVVPRGSEARAGDVLLVPGLTIGSAQIALAAACGRETLAVFKRPQVAIVATGDELVDLADTPQPHQIRNSNGYALAALVEAAGGHARRLPIALDTLDDLRDRIAEGRQSGLLLLSGGVSAGKYDLVEDVLAELGAEFFFIGVRMQPGKPAVFGRLPATGAPHGDATWFFGLPGNPVSTQITFHCFVEPLLRALSGAAVAPPNFVQATLAEDVRGKAGLTRLLPALLRHDLPQPEVRLVPWQGSGDLAANAGANCYALLPDGLDLHAGDVITILLR
ncbi:MAG: molybdopterin molybdotransferase MoeA [Acidobacteriota bacterium]|nr:molybdopterin molybdotransferase MoeA [Acidobacteriota bacterium]